MGSGIEQLFWSVITESSVAIQVVMVLLVFMSIMSWSIIIYKFISLTRAKKRAFDDYENFQKASDLSQAMHWLGGNSNSSLYRIGYMAVRELKRLERAELSTKDKAALALDNVGRALRQGVSFEMQDLSSQLSFLGSCASVAPFLGLFGTVWGIMRSFHAIGQMKTASLAVVGPGIAEALVTTVVGLVVAIPAAMAYNAFAGTLRKIETTMINYSEAFLNRMQRELTWDNKG